MVKDLHTLVKVDDAGYREQDGEGKRRNIVGRVEPDAAGDWSTIGHVWSRS